MIGRQFLEWPFSGWGKSGDLLDVMQRQLDLLSRGFFGDRPAAGVFPLTNVTETPDEFIIRAELPGVAAEDLDITVTGKTVSMAGERRIEQEEGASYHRRERLAGRFARTITLPGDIDTEKIQAKSENGVLTIRAPKAEAAKPRKIVVKG